MIRHVHRDRGFERSLEDLRKRGGTAAAAARKIEEIIGRVPEGGRLGIDGVAKLTRNGEHRIRNCFKYLLGGGYRLICVWRGDHLVLLYAGNHEECHRWIENNKGLTYDTPGEPESDVTAGDRTADGQILTVTWTEADEYEARLMSQLDDQLLRKIFCGLCGEPVWGEAP